MRHLIVIFFLLALAVVFSGPVLSQEEAGAPTDSAQVEIELTDHERAQELLNTLDAELDSLEILQKRSETAEDEQLQLLRVMGERHVNLLEGSQPELFKLLTLLDPEDPETDAITKGTSDYIIAKFRLYDKAMVWWAREIDILREKRSDTPAEELGDLEARIGQVRGRLDQLLVSLSLILENGDTLGIDTESTWVKFDRAINNRAENLVGRLQISVDQRDSLKKKIATSEKAATPEKEIVADHKRLEYAEMRITGIAKSLDRTVDLLGDRGFETTPYRQFIIRSTGEISDRVLDPRVLWGLIKDGLKGLGRWIRDRGPTVLVKLIIVTVIIIFFRLTFRLIWWAMRLMRIVNLTKLMVQLGNSIITPLATLVGLFAGLWFIGANPTTLLTGAGVAGVLIGFALQDSLSNLAAGFFILATRPFDVDDTIRTGTEIGTVKAMWIANTTIVTFDGRRLLIPNRKIWADIIENRSVEPLRRADITVRVGYEEDIDRAIKILLDLVQNEARVLDHPEPAVFVSAWADSWVEVAVRPWTRNEDWWSLLKDLPRLVVLRFAEEGIEIPGPRMEMYGRPDPSE